MVIKTRLELFHLTAAEAGISSQDAYPDVSALPAYTELYRYQVPVDRRLMFLAGHTFSLLAEKIKEGVDAAIEDDGGVQAYDTVDANNATTNDMTLQPAVPVVGDAYYFGYRYPFNGLTIKYSTAANAGHTHAVEYYNGTAWVAVSGLTDPTSAFTAAAGTYNITWTRPKDWAKTTVLGANFYWIRCRVTAIPATPTGAAGDQAWIHPSDTPMESMNKVRVEVRSENELHRKHLIDGAMYQQLSEFTDRDLVYRLDITEPVTADASDWVIVLVKALAPIDVSECYFDLTCNRQRLGII